MKFERKFVLMCFGIDGSCICNAVFDNYETAYDNAIIEASKNLPEEHVLSFTITEVNVNTAVEPLKRGD